VLESLLRAQRDWQFLHFGATKCLPLPNVHVMAWRPPLQLQQVIAKLDVGLMPYDCYSNKNFHCMPLKVFDYFSTGLPVVSTPIVNLWEFSDTIYFGDDADELSRAIQSALDEPADSPKKSARIAIAKEHSIEGLAACLADVLSSHGLLVRQTKC
ncbi:MAG: glycosyltransferase family protein, partial [Nitrososphaerales archaeon]